MITIEIAGIPERESRSVCIFDRLNRDAESSPYSMEIIVGSLRIPERFRVGVAAIASLSDASYNDLVVALKSYSLGKTAGDLASRIEGEVPSIPLSEREEIIAAVSQMQAVHKAAHTDPAKFVSDAWEALEDDSPELIQDLDENTFKTRLGILLSETSVHLTSAKVAELRSEIERSFCGARVLTDIRTAFPDDATKQPAMTILHTLEVKFHDDMGRHREFYVGMDDNDLEILKDAVDRAIQKKATLISLLKEAKFELFD